MTARVQWQEAPFARRFPQSDRLVPAARWSLRSSWQRLFTPRASTAPQADTAPPRLLADQWRSWLLLLLLSSALFLWLVYRSVVQPPWPLQLPGWLLDMLELGEVAGVVTVLLLWAFFTWRAVTAQQTRPAGSGLVPLSIEEMYALAPADFEAYVAELFRRKGHRVRLRGRSGDLGVDLEIVDDRGRRAVVQCKRYQNTIGAEIVRELYGTFIHEEAVHAYLVTTADISDAAREWARGKPLTLIDGRLLSDIVQALAEPA